MHWNIVKRGNIVKFDWAAIGTAGKRRLKTCTDGERVAIEDARVRLAAAIERAYGISAADAELQIQLFESCVRAFSTRGASGYAQHRFLAR